MVAKKSEVVQAKVAYPEDIAAKLAAMATQVKQVEANQISSPRISFKSGIMSYQGNQIPNSRIKVVVVNSAVLNAYYDSMYDGDDNKSPVCFAFGTGEAGEVMAPHPDSAKPQAQTCADCQWSKFKTANNGKGKACKTRRRVALIHADEAAKGPDAIKSTPIAFAEIPTTSMPNYGNYAAAIATAKSVPPLAVVTEMSCAPHAKNMVEVKFEYAGDVSVDSVVALFERQEDAYKTITRPYPKNVEPETPAFETAAKSKY